MVQNAYEISPKKAQILAHDIRWQIMELLSSDETLYAKSIAKILNLTEQKIHYHLTKLRDAGLIVPTGVKPVKRGRAKLFNPIANNFVLSLVKQSINDEETAFNKILSRTFCKNGDFIGKIIVGSAEPHGRYDAISRDGFLTGELCWYLGNHISKKRGFVPHYVSTDLIYEKGIEKGENNLILIGGHITNTLTAHFNTVLKSKFDIYFIENRIRSDNKDFSHPAHGLIALFQNPEAPSFWVLILAGVRSLGTQAAIYAIVSDCCEMLGDGMEFATILQGRSQDGIHIKAVSKVKSKSL
ncbi:MAG: helix-turn-helix domain-containing protein [Candidatus Thorarchaeota archaeon]